MKTATFGIIVALTIGTSAFAAVSPAHYFRVWEGFRRQEISAEGFDQKLPEFMKATVDIYSGKGLNNYIVALPPASKPSFIPDELALVAFDSEQSYQSVRSTSEGQVYGKKHWELFDQASSHSAPKVIDFTHERPSSLEDGVTYDMIGKPIDWRSGYTLVFVGTRNADLLTAKYLERLKTHLELAKKNMVPQGLRGYLVSTHENYEVAYLNWPSKEAHDKAVASELGKRVFKDAGQIMTVVMYEAATLVRAGTVVEAGSVYSTLAVSAGSATHRLSCEDDQIFEGPMTIELHGARAEVAASWSGAGGAIFSYEKSKVVVDVREDSARELLSLKLHDPRGEKFFSLSLDKTANGELRGQVDMLSNDGEDMSYSGEVICAVI